MILLYLFILLISLLFKGLSYKFLKFSEGFRSLPLTQEEDFKGGRASVSDAGRGWLPSGGGRQLSAIVLASGNFRVAGSSSGRRRELLERSSW